MDKPLSVELNRFKYFLLIVLLFVTLSFEYGRHVIILGHNIRDLAVTLVFYGIIVVSLVLWTFSKIEKQREELVKQKRELEKSKSRIEAVLKGIGDGVTVIDRDMKILFANDFLKERFGTDIVGKHCYTVYRDREKTCPDCQVIEALDRKGIVRVQKEREAEDGKKLYYDITASPVLGEKGVITAVVEIVKDITHMKELENRLWRYSNMMAQLVEERTAEVHRLAQITESSADAIISMDLEGNVTSWNRGAEEIFGYTKNEIMGKKFMLMGPKAVVEEARRCFKKVLEKGDVRNEETLRQHKNGKLIPVNLTASLLKDPTGRPLGISAVMKDLTEHKRTEQEVLKLSSAVERAADLIFITDRNGIIEYVNPAFEKITGYSKEEAIGNTPRILKSGKMHPIYAKELWSTILSGKVFRCEVINRAKNGRLFYYDQTITPLKDTSGNITHFISTGKDVTERKEAEKNIRELSQFPEKSPNPVFKIGKDGEILYYNPAVLNYVSDARKIKDILPPNFKKLVTEVCKSGEKIRVEHVFRDVYLDYIIWPISDKTAHVYGRDITEIKKAEHLLLRTQKLAAVGRLAAGLAHEINNPLGNISLYADMLLRKARGGDREKLQVIKNQVDIAAKHLKDFMELSHPSEAEYSKIDLGQVLYKALKALRPMMKKAGIQLNQNIETGVMVVGNPIQLQQAFSNILLNAIQAMPQGGKLGVTMRKRHNTVEAEILDTGPGIHQDEIDKIFDPFYTTKGVGKGTGLGLFITHMIIGKHEGRIDVKSKPGEGSSFTVVLPVGEGFEN